jgi:hypothetical protein
LGVPEAQIGCGRKTPIKPILDEVSLWPWAREDRGQIASGIVVNDPYFKPKTGDIFGEVLQTTKEKLSGPIINNDDREPPH